MSTQQYSQDVNAVSTVKNTSKAFARFNDLRSKYDNMSLQQLNKALESYNEILLDPEKSATLSTEQLTEMNYINNLIADRRWITVNCSRFINNVMKKLITPRYSQENKNINIIF